MRLSMELFYHVLESVHVSTNMCIFRMFEISLMWGKYELKVDFRFVCQCDSSSHNSISFRLMLPLIESITEWPGQRNVICVFFRFYYFICFLFISRLQSNEKKIKWLNSHWKYNRTLEIVKRILFVCGIFKIQCINLKWNFVIFQISHTNPEEWTDLFAHVMSRLLLFHLGCDVSIGQQRMFKKNKFQISFVMACQLHSPFWSIKS